MIKKVAIVLLLGLIVGIFGSATTEYSNLIPNPESTSDYQIFPDVEDLFILILKAKDVVKDFKEDCQRYGDKGSFEIFKTNVANVIRNLRPVVMSAIEAFLENKNSIKSKGVINIVGPHLCPLVPDFTITVKKLIKSYKNCLKPNIREDVDVEGGVILPLLEYVCENQAMMEAIEKDDDNCIKMDEPTIVKCFNKTEESSNYTEQKIAELLINVLISAVSLEDCRFIDGFRICIDESLNECESVKYKKFINDVVVIIERHTPCRKLLNNESELNSSADAVHVLLINNFIITLLLTLSFV